MFCVFLLAIILITLFLYDYLCRTIAHSFETESNARLIAEAQQHQGDLRILYQSLLKSQHDLKHKIATVEGNSFTYKLTSSNKYANYYKVAIEGRIQTGSYQNKNGDTVYTTDVIANRVEFLDWGDRQQGGGGFQQGADRAPAPQAPQAPQSPAEDRPDSFQAIEEDVPF